MDKQKTDGLRPPMGVPNVTGWSPWIHRRVVTLDTG